MSGAAPVRWLTAGIIFMMLPWGAAAGPAQPDEPDQRLQFWFGSFDPTQGQAPGGFDPATRFSAGPFVVQFEYPTKGTEKPRIESAGGTVAAYIPDGGFVVVAQAGFALRAARMDGVRWVGLLPAWARISPSAEGAPSLRVLFSGPIDSIVSAAKAAGAVPVLQSAGSAVFTTRAGAAAALAALSQVTWVEGQAVIVPHNYRATITDRLRASSNASAYDPALGALWTYNGNASDPQLLGYTGGGVTIDVVDAGVDGTHPAFAGRMKGYRAWAGQTAWVDTVGHGTHVAAAAAGSGEYFAADGAMPPFLYAGAAPGAWLDAQAYNAPAPDYEGMADYAVTQSAVVSVNSWGDPTAATLGNYTSAAQAYDNLTADASVDAGDQPILFVFAAGNGNQFDDTITPPATAKNVLSVGGVGNDYPGGTSSWELGPFSSLGPADDGRIKPDIVAPGERVASANSSQDASAGVPPLPPDAGTSYVFLSGTSQAAPHAAGAAAVASQYLSDVRGVTATPALLKAALINGATPLPMYPWPGKEQGWGRLDAAASLLNTSTRHVDFVPEGFYTFDSAPDVIQYNVSIDAGQDLRITLVWTDAPGSPLAAKALVNDLDLEVRDSLDTVLYRGNAINRSMAYSIDDANTTSDRTNNVEVVRIENASAGVWKVFVWAHSLATAPQTFALAISGALNQTLADIVALDATVRGSPATIESGSMVTVDGAVLNAGAVGASNVTFSAVLAEDGSVVGGGSLGSIAPAQRVNLSFSFVPPDGANTVRITVLFDGADADLANNLATLAFFVTRRQPVLSGIADAEAPPGGIAAFALLAVNRGNTRETLYIAQSFPPGPPTWNISFSQSQVTLDPDEVAAWQAFVEIPANATPGASSVVGVSLSSAANASAKFTANLTARAAGLHSVRVEPMGTNITARPRVATLVQVRITNMGNGVENITLTATPLWNGSALWGATSFAAMVAPGAAVIASLNISNQDLGAPSYRGEMRLRAALDSTNATFDAQLPVFVAPEPCIDVPSTGIDSYLVGTGPHTSQLTVANCGNVPLSFTVGGSAGNVFEMATIGPLPLSPWQQLIVNFSLGAPDDLPDGTYPFHLEVQAGLVSTYRSPVIEYASNLQIRFDESTPSRIVMPRDGGSFVLAFENVGGNGTLWAPRLGSVPDGWEIIVEPQQQALQAGAQGNLTITVRRQNASLDGESVITLTFFPGAVRSFDWQFTFVLAAAADQRPPTSAWPTDLSPSLAVLLGALFTAFAAMALAPSRRLARVCPACGHKAPRFDTFMNPSCGECGETLAPRKGTKR